MSEDRAKLDELFASSMLAHIGLTIDGCPAVFPTAFAAIDDRIVIHGSTGSRWMRAIAGQQVAVEVTKVDGCLLYTSRCV